MQLQTKPIDDTYRFPLYAYKYSNGMHGSEIASEIAKPYLEPLIVPNESIIDVDEFMTLYKDKRMSDFRAKVNEYERKEISRTDLRRKLAQEKKKLEKLELNSWEVLIYGISGGYGLGACLATGTVAPLISLLPTLNVLRKAITKRGYKWLEFAEGIAGVFH